MKNDDYYIQILSNWMTLQPVLGELDREELIKIYRIESRVRRRTQILDRIYKRMMNLYRLELKAELKTIFEEERESYG
jgi:hypothetical protein